MLPRRASVGVASSSPPISNARSRPTVVDTRCTTHPRNVDSPSPDVDNPARNVDERPTNVDEHENTKPLHVVVAPTIATLDVVFWA